MENLTLFNLNKSIKISSSMLSLYSSCPRRYKLAYIDKKPHLERNEGLLVGTNFHNILRDFYSTNNRTLLHFNKLIDERFKEPWNSRAKLILSNYYQEQDINVNPLFIEKSFKVNYLDQILIGKFDRVDKTNDGIEIIDYKFGETLKDMDEIKEKIQWIFYWISFEKAFKEIGPVKKFSYLFLNANKKITIEPTEPELTKAKLKVNNLILKLLNDKEFIANANPHCKDCMFRNECKK